MILIHVGLKQNGSTEIDMTTIVQQIMAGYIYSVVKLVSPRIFPLTAFAAVTSK